MTIPRQQQISLHHTPYYHCTTRCVRRAFLCGKDRYSGKNFDHRKNWMERRLQLLSRVFSIDLLAYAIMSNHYHVVVRLSDEQALSWTDEEVVQRWDAVFSLPDTISDEHIALWRERLSSLSWYMRCLNEPLARASNREDECTGRFWEGRFKCQALLDESALVKCMAYVDLNPIRAAMADTPATSNHTSIKARIDGKDAHLLAFADQGLPKQLTIPVRQQDYYSLLDWSGRVLHPDKRGRIPDRSPPILKHLDINPTQWVSELTHFGSWYYRAVGSVISLERFCQYLGQQWLKGTVRAANISA